MSSIRLLPLLALALATSSALAQSFPAPSRPVAQIVSSTWGDDAFRDRARETDQIIARLRLKPGMTIADIGAGSGYESLRLARKLGRRTTIISEDVDPTALQGLSRTAKAQGLETIRTVTGSSDDARLGPGSIDAAIMVHMYHEIARPYDLLWRLAAAFRPGGRLGVEELDRPSARHGTPAKLLTCELSAVGYRLISLEPLEGGLGYFAVFEPPSAAKRPAPEAIKPCSAA